MDINSLLYDNTKEEILAAISQMKDSDLLYIYADHYNWDDGFEIPQAILKHNLCLKKHINKYAKSFISFIFKAIIFYLSITKSNC